MVSLHRDDGSVNGALGSRRTSSPFRAGFGMSTAGVSSDPVELPLGGTQRSIWSRETLHPGSLANVVAHAVTISSRFDADAFGAALDATVERHDALRTTFVERDGVPHQIVHEAMPSAFDVFQVADLDDAALSEAVTRAASIPFDLGTGPLLRLSVFSRSTTDHILLIVAHHIVVDMWTIALLVHELSETYTASIDAGRYPTLPTPGRLADVIGSERRLVDSERGRAAVEFWRAELRDAPALSALPHDRPPTSDTDHRAALQPIALRTSDADAVRRLASEIGTTREAVLLSCLAELLRRWTGADDLTLGQLRANRTARTARTMGCLVNPVAVRCHMSGDPTVAEFVRSVHAASKRSSAHGRFPLHELINELRPPIDATSTPWFQVVMSWQKTSRLLDERLAANLALGTGHGNSMLADMQVSAWELDNRGAPYDVTLLVADDGDDLLATVEYRHDLYEPDTIRAFADHFLALVRAMVADPGAPVRDLSLMSPDQERQFITGPVRGEPPADVDRPATIHGTVEQQAARTPDAVAVVDETQRLTYAALQRRVESSAARLRRLGVGDGDLVAIHLERTVDLPVALLAVLRCGAGYVPLDRAWPAERLTSIVEGVGARALICSGPAPWIPPGVVSIPVDSLTEPGADDVPADDAGEESIAYVIHTSGSTGRPKGVVVEHRHVLALARSWVDRPGLGADDTVLACTTISFDPSVIELLLPVMVGARTIIAPDGAAADPRLLARLVEQHGATIVQATPTTWRMLVEEGFTGSPHLTALSGGESLTADLASALSKRCKRVWNLYGPTEATVWTTAHELVPGDDPVPLGDPLGHASIYVLDPRGNLVPPEMPGELWIGGAGVARGYHDRDELTSQRFTADPFDEVGRGRMYATGDLVRRRLDGSLHYLGRTDDQLKVRGNRIEPAEIEAVLRTHRAVVAAAIAAEEVNPGDVRLVAHVVMRSGESFHADDLRAHTRTRLPDPLVPARVVEASRLPTTTTGKLDRAALPRVLAGHAPDGAGPGSGTTDVPTDGTTAAVAIMWAAVLGIERVGVHDDFFDLGGHSLLATQIVSRMRQELQLDVQVRDVFDARTVSALVRRARPHGDPTDSDHGADEPTDPAPGQLHPVSHSQRRMWFIHQLDPDGAAYNLAAAVDIEGALDVDALDWSVNRLVERHETLRSVFVNVDGVPLQRIHPHRDVHLEIVDHSGLDPDARRSSIDAAERQAARRPFDLSTGPVIRFTLHRSSPEQHTLLGTMHHIVSDQWAFGVIAAELSELYRSRLTGSAPRLPPAGGRHAEFVRWQHSSRREADVERQLGYWREQLAGLEPVELPSDRPRPPVRSSQGETITMAIPPDIHDGVDQLCRELGVTPFIVMLAAFDVLISRYTNADDIAVGTPIANRNRTESERLISSFVNTLVMRTSLADDITFQDVIERVRSTALDAYEHQDVPFDRLVDELKPPRDMSRTPLFQLFFNVQNAPVVLPEFADARVSFRAIPRGATQFDLSFTIDTAVAGTAAIEYSTDLFDRSRMRRMLEHFWTLLRAGIGDPTANAHELPILTPAEHAALSAPGEPLDAPSSCTHELFQHWVTHSPEAPAVVSGTGTMTYRELDELAERIADGLGDAGVGPGDIVGIRMDRSADLIAAMLGTWKAGAAYVPLDTTMPPDRLAFMVSDIGVRLIVTDPEGEDDTHVGSGGGGASAAPTWTVRQLVSAASGSVRAGPRSSADDLAYVIFTSGSTGRPKGVEVEHRHLAAFLHAFAQRLGLGPTDSTLSVTTLTFDPSLVELILPLTIGGHVGVIGRETSIDPRALTDAIDRLRPTVLQATPTTWHLLVDHGWQGGDDITALCGGEVLTKALASELADRTRRVVNLYGPTETTVWATTHEVGPHEDPVPIGTPIPGVTTRVVDRDGRLVPNGVPGELWIGGACVARGYRSRPELTAERFVPDPFTAGHGRLYRTGDLVVRRDDGTLHFHGRSDHQIKLRGIRVELGEIESVLAEHPAVARAVVTVRTDQHGYDRLVGYVVLDPDRSDDPTVSEMKSAAARQLPPNLVPPVVVILDAWPLTTSGKIDRGALPAPIEERRPDRIRSLMSTSEAQICAIWERVLGVDAVDPDDDFFDLGGHSLLALRMVAELEKVTKTPIPVTLLFRAPTPARLARVLSESGWQSPRASLVPIRSEGSRRPFFHVAPYQITALSFASLARHLDPERPCYVLQPPGLESPEPPILSRIEDIASHHLREIRDVQPEGPYALGGHCSGAPVALEMARQLEDAGERIQLLVIVDAAPPAGAPPRIGRRRYLLGRLRHYVRDGRLFAAMRWQRDLAVQRLLLIRVGDERRRRMARVRRAHALAHQRYVGTIVGCDGLFVRSAEWASLPDKQWHDQWSQVITGELSTETVPGTHAGLVENRYARELARIVERALESRRHEPTDDQAHLTTAQASQRPATRA